jgi:hypothetical protein
MDEHGHDIANCHWPVAGDNSADNSAILNKLVFCTIRAGRKDQAK